MATAAREWFTVATAGALDVIAAVPADAWEAPGLGEWTVRELVAHLRRSWVLIGDYLAEPTPDTTDVLTAASYVAVGLVQPGIHAGVLARGRDDAAALGDDPMAAVQASAHTARDLVATTDPARIIPTRIAPMRFDEFVRTRAFELTVHGLDVARAIDGPTGPLDAATAPALALVAEIATERGLGAPLLLAATGRGPLPPGFTLLG